MAHEKKLLSDLGIKVSEITSGLNVSAGIDVKTEINTSGSGTATDICCRISFFDDAATPVLISSHDGVVVAATSAEGEWQRYVVEGITIPALALRVDIGYHYASTSDAIIDITSRRASFNRGNIAAPYSDPVSAGGGGTLGSDYLRSNLTDNYTSGTLTFDIGTIFNIKGIGNIDDPQANSQPIGYNTLPIYVLTASDIFDTAHQGMIWLKDTGGIFTLTCDQVSGIDQGATWVVHNTDTEDLTIAQGTGVTISFVTPGSAPATGSVIVKQGGLVTVYKRDLTNYWVWGAVSETLTSTKNSIEVDAGDVQLVGDLASPGNNQVYGTTGAGVKGWKADPSGGGVTSLPDLSDVTITSVVTNELLQFTGTVWENQTYAEADVAQDSLAAHLAGIETFTGTKTFNATTFYTGRIDITKDSEVVRYAASSVEASHTTPHEIRVNWTGTFNRIYWLPRIDGTLDFNKEFSFNFAAEEWQFDELNAGILTATSYGGIAQANLLNKSANEILSGMYIFSGLVTESDFGTGAKIKDGTDVTRPIGFNVLPVFETVGNDTFDLAHNGMLWHKDDVGTFTFTCANDATIPQGATYVVHNDRTEDLTIAQGTGVTIAFLAPGAAPVTGSVILKQGAIVTVYKFTDTEFWVWGASAPLSVFTSTDDGLAPLSGGGTTNFLRADGTWTAPPGGGGSGNVSSVGTPLNNQIAIWTTATDIEGVAGLTFDGTSLEATQIAGIVKANLLDKSASETISGPVWTFTSANKMRLENTGDAGLATDTHAFQVGNTGGGNIIIDPNEIMARNNGVISNLNLNADGGSVTVGANTTGVPFVVKGAITATAYGSITEADLLDKSVAETVGGPWTFTNATPFNLSISSTTTGILLDNNSQKRICWNDGGGNLLIRSGSYFNAGEKYVLAGDGAVRMQFTSDGLSGIWRADVAGTGVSADDPITYAASLQLTTTSLTLTGANLLAGTVDADFDALTATSYGGISAANLLDKTAVEVLSGMYTLDGPITESDFGTGGKVKDGTDTARPIGFNVLPVYEIDANDTFDLAHNGMLWHKDAGGVITFTCANDANIPQGATYVVHNDDTEDLTIAQGTGVTIEFLAPGAAPATGSVIVKQGGIVTVYKYTDTIYWLWGSVGDPLSAGIGITFSGTNEIDLDISALTNIDIAATASADSLLFNDAGVMKQIDIQDMGVRVVNSSAIQTFALADANTLQTLTGATNRVWTIPTNASEAFKIGAIIYLAARDTATITVTASSGVTLTSIHGSNAAGSDTVDVGGMAALIKVATDEWMLSGDVST